ncbi:AAA family ATPase [Lutibacter sp. A64]|uniref:TrlF family AAA-like ATPase n=1 Tax=Lutibacter sp. A64 TaxID=2918526 RepID=UPI001F0554C7|nr:ABC transporter ATP-binding protein [Lutibacter sp. A64]UMB55337.1 AAA family ATPase [Lutibacter sp. A64]
MKKEKTNQKFPKGAEWRKWDLHVHSPYTFMNRYSSTDEEFIKKIQDEDISVIGITNYFKFSDEEFNLITKLRSVSVQAFLNLELRLDYQNKDDDCLDLHIIFSETVEKTDIQKFLQNLTVNVEGKDKKADDLATSDDFKKAVVNFDKLIDELNQESLNLKGKYLVGFLSRGKGNARSSSNFEKITSKTSFLIHSTDNPKNINDDRLFWLKYEKPLFQNSDAHSLQSIGSKNTWVKADSTFDGLKQVLNEPEERIYIGESPSIKKRVLTNKTKYIKSLSVKSIPSYSGGYGKWFSNVNIPLNPELVAIIGNKGSGKSAMADIIGLCGNAKIRVDDFSFLNRKKFRSGGDRIAKNFEANLLWESGTSKTKTLDSNIGEEIQMVKYLPQGYFERLTNEISSVEEFQEEIENVVFTHINSDDRGDFTSFDELIRHKKNISNQEINLIKQELKPINEEIINLEKKRNAKYKEKIKNSIRLKKDELKALNEPKAVSNPDTDPKNVSQNKVILDAIEKIDEKIQKISESIQKKIELKKELITELDEIKTIKEDFEFKKREYDDFKVQKETILTKYKLVFDDIFEFKLNLKSINDLIKKKKKELLIVKTDLGDETSKDPNFNSLETQLEILNKELKIEQNKLDGPQKAYQLYLTKKKEWEKQKALIIGADDKLNTLKFFEKELKFLTNDLSSKLDELKDKRNQIAKRIFDKKQAIISIYKKIKSDIDSIIKDNSSLVNDYKININAALTLKLGFNDKFFNFINQNVIGTFYNKENGQQQLNQISNGLDFDKKDEVISFLDSLVDAISFDKRDSQNNAERYINEQLKEPEEFYDYLFSLDFLDYNYQLKQGDKTLEQLSPGEKGALLLVFYLLLDKEDIPLIIDQPEDNLDNHSVANILVPFIRIAKKNRQIIMVTHNPNLAVVSDAEQVIYVNLDKENNHQFETISGSIEDRTINESIVKVLEGAMPAFNKRKQKYYEH